MNKVHDYLKAHKHFFFFLLGSLGLFAIDIISKWIVEKNVALYEEIALIPNFLYITKSYNIAIAFSIGEQLGVWGRVINIAISVVMSIIIFLVWFFKKDKLRKREHVIAMLLFAGAFGNLIDRAFYWFDPSVGPYGVIDFIRFYLGGGPNAAKNFVNPFATFNIADACLVIGIIMLIIVMIIDSIKASKDPENDLTQDPRTQNIENPAEPASNEGEEDE